MKRKVLTILLALCVALTMMPTVALADTPTGTALTLTDVTNDGTLVLTDGNSYFLDTDITISKTIEISGTVTLDLNGHVLKYENASTNGSVIKITSSGNLTLKDSNNIAEHKFDTTNDLWVLAADDATGDNIKKVTGGIITGGTGTKKDNHTYGGGVYVDLGTFTMNGGNIVGCSSTTTGNTSHGGGISANGNYKDIENCKVVNCNNKLNIDN